MTGGPGTGGGASGKRFAAVIGAIVVVGLLALGAAWWFLDRMVDEMGERRRKFDEIDRKIEAFRPTARSAALRPARDPSATEFVVRLCRTLGSTTTEIVTEEIELGEFTSDRAEVLQVLAKGWRMRNADAAGQDSLRGVVEADPAVPSKDVIRAVDALIAAGLKDVTFSGTPEPGSTLDRVMGGGK